MSLLALLDTRQDAPKSLLSGLRAIDEASSLPAQQQPPPPGGSPGRQASASLPTVRSMGSNSVGSPQRQGPAEASGTLPSAASALPSRRSTDGGADGGAPEAHSGSKKRGRPWAGTRQARCQSASVCCKSAWAFISKQAPG